NVVGERLGVRQRSEHQQHGDGEVRSQAHSGVRASRIRFSWPGRRVTTLRTGLKPGLENSQITSRCTTRPRGKGICAVSEALRVIGELKSGPESVTCAATGST